MALFFNSRRLSGEKHEKLTKEILFYFEFHNRVFFLDGFFREEGVMDFDENTTSLTCPKDKLELVFLAMFASELVGSRQSSLLVQFS